MPPVVSTTWQLQNIQKGNQVNFIEAQQTFTTPLKTLKLAIFVIREENGR